MESLSTIAIVSVLISISPYLSNITKIPVAVVEMSLGAFAVLFGLFGESDMLAIVGKVGFLYLMFLAGMEVDLRSLAKMEKSLIRRAIRYFFILYSISFAIYFYSDLPIIYFIALPVVSLGMIMALIRDYGKEHEWVKLALILGIFGEIVSITALVILDGVLKHGISYEFWNAMFTLTAVTIGVTLFFKAIKILFWWFPEVKMYIMPFEDSKNQDIRFSMTLFFIMISIMLFLELEMVLGAFLAGVFISTFFEHKKELPKKLSTFGFGFLVPIFFIHIGSTLDLVVIATDMDIVLKSFMIVASMVMMHLICSNLVFARKLGPLNSNLLGLSLSMPLTFLVAVATIGYNTQSITREDYYAFITAAMLEAIVIMIGIKIITTVSSKIKARRKKSVENSCQI